MTIKGNELIMTYGLTKEEESIVKKTVKKYQNGKLKYEKAGCVTDCIGYLPMLSFIRTDKIKDKDMEFLNSIYDEFSDNNVYVGYDERAKFKKKMCDKNEFNKKVEFTFMKMLKKKKKQVNFSIQLTHILRVLKEILNKPYITTKEIAKEVEISPKTVIRNIETLNMAKEDIIFDKNKKGWYVPQNYSMLISDILRGMNNGRKNKKFNK